MKQMRIGNRLGRGGCVLLVGLLGVRAMGQTAYFSLEGDVVAAGDQLDFNLDLTRDVSSSEALSFVTWASSGGTNSAGDTIASGGIDSVLELFDAVNATRGYSDDEAGYGLDSLISWSSLQANGIPLNPDPLAAGTYRLHLNEYNNDGTGAWAQDLVGPADALQMTGIAPTGTATIKSLKFGTLNSTGSAATFNNTAGSLTITDALTIAQTGKATLNLPQGSITVGGVTTVKSGGTFNLTGGTFNANGDLSVEGGSFDASGGVFNLASGKTLSAGSDGQVQLNSTLFLNGSKTIDLNSGADLTNTGQLSVGAVSTGTINVSGAGTSLTQNGSMYISQQDATGSVTVDSSGTLNVNGIMVIAGFYSGSGSDGGLSVLTGAGVNADSVFIGYNDGDQGTGTLTVDGSGSTFVQSAASSLTVGNADTPGNNGVHTVNIQNLGVFTTGTGNISINKTGTLNINTSGALNANGDVYVDGGTLSSNGGSFNLAAGKNVTASNDGQVSFSGDYGIGGGSTFTIQSGADLSSSSFIDVGNGSVGTLVVDGAGSTVSTNSTSYWGSDGGTADVTLSNDSSATLKSLAIGRSTTANTSAIVRVQSGADLTADGTTIAVDGSDGGSGTLTVDGSGSSVMLNGSSPLIIGDTSLGTATLNVQNNGVFTTGTSSSSIYATGTVNINTGGTFNSLGDLNVVGGTLTRDSGSTFSLAAGKTLTASDNAQVGFAGYTGIDISDGKRLEVNTGADLDTGSITVGSGSTGTLIVDGSGTTLNITNTSTGNFGDSGGSAGVEVRNGATMAGGSNWNMRNGSFTATGSGTGVTQGSSALLSVGSNISGAFTLNVQNNAGFTTGQDFTEIINNGTLNVGTGASFTAKGQFRIDGGTVNLSGGTFTAPSFYYNYGSGIFSYSGGTLHVGTFYGNLSQNGGTLSPGSSAGLTTIDGNYSFNSGTIEIELGGTTQDTGYDHVNVTGSAVIYGGLSVSFIDGFTPSAGDSFSFLTADGLLIDSFNLVDLPDISGLNLAWDLVNSGGALTLYANSTLPGDLNNDGYVGLDDLQPILDHWNQNVTVGDATMGDIAGPGGGGPDGYVGLDDLQPVLDHWNEGTPPVPAGAASIPEPGSVALVLVSGLALLRRRSVA